MGGRVNDQLPQRFRRIRARYDRLISIQRAWNEIAATIIYFRIASPWVMALGKTPPDRLIQQKILVFFRESTT